MIRQAQSSDTVYLADGLKNLVEHIHDTSGDAYFVDLDQNYHHGFTGLMTNLLEASDTQILVAVDGEKAQGFIIGHIKKPFLPFSGVKQIGEISICWVDPDARGQGIASQLVDEIEQWFIQHNISYVELHYIVGNSEAERFWPQRGYTPYRIAGRKQI